MKLTDRYTPAVMQRRPRTLWDTYAVLMGHVFDDKFPDSHIMVYEHDRPPLDELLAPEKNGPLYISSPLGANDLAEEEKKILQILRTPEESRMLCIVGDVGVGKTTFLKHLEHEHFSTSNFGAIAAVYTDWRAFTASELDPLPAIYRHFCNEVYPALEKHLSQQEQISLDDSIFDTAKMFSRERIALLRIAPNKRKSYKAEAIASALKDSPIEFAFARINKTSYP